MPNIALQVERLAAGTITVGSPVVFDNVVYSAGNITYNAVTGVITFNEAGTVCRQLVAVVPGGCLRRTDFCIIHSREISWKEIRQTGRMKCSV